MDISGSNTQSEWDSSTVIGMSVTSHMLFLPELTDLKSSVLEMDPNSL